MKNNFRTGSLLASAFALLACLVLVSTSSAQTTALLSINPALSEVQVGSTFTVAVDVADVVDLYAFELNVRFPPNLVSVTMVENGGFLTPWVQIPLIDNDLGLVQLAVSQVNPTLPQSGSGTLMVITFQAKTDIGEGDLWISESILSDIDGMAMAYTQLDGHLRVCDGVYCNNLFLPLITR